MTLKWCHCHHRCSNRDLISSLVNLCIMDTHPSKVKWTTCDATQSSPVAMSHDHWTVRFGAVSASKRSKGTATHRHRFFVSPKLPASWCILPSFVDRERHRGDPTRLSRLDRTSLCAYSSISKESIVAALLQQHEKLFLFSFGNYTGGMSLDDEKRSIIMATEGRTWFVGKYSWSSFYRTERDGSFQENCRGCRRVVRKRSLPS